MKFEQITPTIINIIVRLVIYIVVFFMLLNIFLAWSNYERLYNIATLVQHSVRRHNYLPENDRAAIQNLIDMYMYNTDDSHLPDESYNFLNIHKVVTNLKIVVYGEDRNLASPVVHGYDYDIENNRKTLTYTEEERYYFGDEARDNKHKQQQGSVLYAGITFQYHIIHPLSWWEPADISLDLRGDDLFAEKNNVPWLTDTRKKSEVLRDLYQEGDINTGGTTTIDSIAGFQSISGASSGSSSGPGTSTGTGGISYSLGQRSLFIMPVICNEFYADLDQAASYTGGS